MVDIEIQPHNGLNYNGQYRIEGCEGLHAVKKVDCSTSV